LSGQLEPGDAMVIESKHPGQESKKSEGGGKFKVRMF
jgi:hypothetical protein